MWVLVKLTNNNTSALVVKKVFAWKACSLKLV